MREPNLEKLNALVGKLVGDLGISLGGASILLGDRLGLYKAMADGAVVTPSELAKKTGLHERYVREWLSGQAASGYIDYHPEKNAFSLSAEQAMAFAEEGSPKLSLPVHSMSCNPPAFLRRTQGRRSVLNWERRWLARAFQVSFLGHRTLLQAGL